MEQQDIDFCYEINIFADELHLSAKRMAALFLASVHTVYKWKTGALVPNPKRARQMMAVMDFCREQRRATRETVRLCTDKDALNNFDDVMRRVSNALYKEYKV